MLENQAGGAVIEPHKQLQQERIRQKKTCEDVATALNLLVSTIETLEAGDFDKLHGEAFVTGYMRSYASYLQLSQATTNELIEAFLLLSRPLNGVEQYQEPAMFNARLTQVFQHQQHKTGYGLAAAVFLVATLGFFSVDEADRPQPAIASDDIHLQTEAGTTIISSLQKLPADNPTQDILPIVSVVQATLAADSPQQTQLARAVQRQEGVAHSQLAFQFSADCWVEILDGDNKIIYASLQKSQQRLQLAGKPPFRITLGYAPGVELSYNGRPVDLTAKKADLVKLVLGNS